jgi:hypothetical protein
VPAGGRFAAVLGPAGRWPATSLVRTLVRDLVRPVVVVARRAVDGSNEDQQLRKNERNEQDQQRRGNKINRTNKPTNNEDQQEQDRIRHTLASADSVPSVRTSAWTWWPESVADRAAQQRRFAYRLQASAAVMAAVASRVSIVLPFAGQLMGQPRTRWGQ